MKATFNPISGFSIEFQYDRADLSHAIAAQVAVWVKGITSGFLGLCEATVSKGQKARAQVNHNVIQVRKGVVEATIYATAEGKGLAVALVIATGRRIQCQTQRSLLPPFNALAEHYLSARNTVQSAITAYIEGVAGQPIQVQPSDRTLSGLE